MKNSSIRRKAQEYVRKRDWNNALKEYKRLTEIDKSNPNVFNELGDIYLKLGNKPDAFRSYQKAIEAYKNVSLYNNAIAVCKKVLRYNPNDLDVLFTLAQLRKIQGITREAVSYFVSYMEKLVLNVNFDPEQQKDKLMTIADEMPTSPEVLEKVSDYLLKWDFKPEAGAVLTKLAKLYKGLGMEDRRREIEEKIKSTGYRPAEKTGDGGSPDAGASSAGERVSIPAEEGKADQYSTSSPGSGKPGSKDESDNHLDYGNIEIGGDFTEGSGNVGVQTLKKQDAGEKEGVDGKGENVEAYDKSSEVKPADGTVDKENRPEGQPKNTVIVSKADGPGVVVHVSKIIDEFKDEVEGAIADEDYHTHYDLGMAYLEMNLLPEAIREFQLASKSPEYQVSSLEMVGLCFIKQNSPHLAIKQLEKGLSMVGNSDRNALGLIYTLGLAYEMAGDIEKAKEFFEDVYVVDVGFRDVSEKIRKYSS